LCGVTSQAFIFKESYVDRGSTYDLFECPSCRAEFWTPLKNPGAEWYESDYRYVGANNDPIQNPIWNHRKVIHYLAPKTGSVLDVGCGTGSFLYHAQSKGWQVHGIDFDRNAIEAAKNVFHLHNVEVNDLGGYARNHPHNHFDLITFFDVFEHIDNHNEFIAMTASMLNPNGYVAMSMPYRHAAKWLIPHDRPPRHLTRWDRSSLTTFLEKHGFDVEYCTRRSEGIAFLILKLRFKFGKYTSFNVVQRFKKKTRGDGPIVVGSTTEKKIGRVARLAKIKDYILFGLPALLIWLCMLPTRKRYITLYAIARKK
jgi:SAM-dependent methyltransferase